jgi:hypothetical protein
MIERPANDVGQHSRTADALDLWRAGERNVTRRTLNRDWRDDYLAAVDAALDRLQGYVTMAELVSAYFDLEQGAWLETLCQRPSGRVLNYGDVEDAAYWRRCQQLLAAVVARG